VYDMLEKAKQAQLEVQSAERRLLLLTQPQSFPVGRFAIAAAKGTWPPHMSTRLDLASQCHAEVERQMQFETDDAHRKVCTATETVCAAFHRARYALEEAVDVAVQCERHAHHLSVEAGYVMNPHHTRAEVTAEDCAQARRDVQTEETPCEGSEDTLPFD